MRQRGGCVQADDDPPAQRRRIGRTVLSLAPMSPPFATLLSPGHIGTLELRNRALGASTDDSVATALQACGAPLHRIGDCAHVGYIEGALHDGHRVGRQI